jgi:dTDP-4-dehydrorhamnose reductase
MSTVTETKSSSPEIWGGIESTVNRVKDLYLDQFEEGGLYHSLPLQSIASLGIKKLRFPVLWEKHQPGPATEIDWSWTEDKLEFFRNEKIEVIAGLVHHGSGPVYTNLLDENFPELLAAYGGKVAKRFPWIKYYTPVNEPLTTARFSSLYGFWYPHSKDEISFIKALLNQLKGIVLSMQEIRKVNPDAKLVQTEDLGKTYSTPLLKYQADFENERRWLTYDILCGRFDRNHKLWNYYRKKGVKESLLNFFIDNPCVPDVFGFNHYVTSERYLDHNVNAYPENLHGGNGKHKYADIEAARAEIMQPHGIQVLLKEAWLRYKQPVAITEVHLHCHREEQVRWFKYIYEAACSLNDSGIPVTAVTAWALFGSYGWNKLLTEPGGEYEPGVFDMRSGLPRATALTNYIRSLSNKQIYNHTYFTQTSGWWQRSSRFINKPVIENMEVIHPKKDQTRPVLIIGKNGTLGKAFAKACEKRAISYKLMSRADCDIVNANSVEAAIKCYDPWAIINAAGYVRVDDAEDEFEQCYRENFFAAATLAVACVKNHVKLVTFSTDLVFNGDQHKPYVETDQPDPLNNYGKSKLAAEKEVANIYPQALVVRTSAFFGPDDEYNFLRWVEKNLSAGIPITVASDISVSPTYVPDLADACLDLLIDEEMGIWHLANKGSITWYELALKVATQLGFDTALIQPRKHDEMNFKAPRPLYSVLGTEKGHLLPGLNNAIDRYFAETKKTTESQNITYALQSGN